MTTSTRLPTMDATHADNWRTAAACQNVEDPEIFFPIGHTPQAIAQEAEAKKVCYRCPVIDRCLQWALETGQETGVWGGLAEDDRRAMKRKPIRTIVAPEPSNRKSHSHRYPGYATAVDGILATRIDEVQGLLGRKASVHDIAAALGTNRSTVKKVLERLQQPADDSAEQVDHAAVNRFVQGFAAEVKDADFLAGVQICVGRGMTLPEIDRLHMWEERTTENRVNRMRKRYKRAGREFPSLAQPSVRRFSEAEVVAIREKSMAGASDIELAMSFDVRRETIRSICRGLSYQQFGGPLRGARGGAPGGAAKEWGSGHAAKSLDARTEMEKNEMGEAA